MFPVNIKQLANSISGVILDKIIRMITLLSYFLPVIKKGLCALVYLHRLLSYFHGILLVFLKSDFFFFVIGQLRSLPQGRPVVFSDT